MANDTQERLIKEDNKKRSKHEIVGMECKIISESTTLHYGLQKS